jgi:hypothetical protein
MKNTIKSIIVVALVALLIGGSGYVFSGNAQSYAPKYLVKAEISYCPQGLSPDGNCYPSFSHETITFLANSFWQPTAMSLDCMYCHEFSGVSFLNGTRCQNGATIYDSGILSLRTYNGTPTFVASPVTKEPNCWLTGP